ncbi:MAG: ankyrin repeat domain-containing protein [Actinomycetota bacterium]
MASALLSAIDQGNLQAVMASLENGANVEEPDVHGFPGLPLRMAAFRGHNRIIQELLRRGADVDCANSEGAGAPLRLAVRGGHLATTRFLLENGASLVPGLDLGLSRDEIFRAELISRVNREAAVLAERHPSSSPPDEIIGEVILKPAEFEALFGKLTGGIQKN